MHAGEGSLINSPIGLLEIRLHGRKLSRISLLFREGAGMASPERPLQEIHGQLAAYFADGRFRFSLPLHLEGTDFQRRVWQALCRIPPGETRRYGEIARELGSSPRAVGNACRMNPIPLVIPCHRVVSAQGIGGFSGKTSGKWLAAKRWLLAHEGVSL